MSLGRGVGENRLTWGDVKETSPSRFPEVIDLEMYSASVGPVHHGCHVDFSVQDQLHITLFEELY